MTDDDLVLVVDDDVDICETLAMILESRGYTCVIAHDGAEALRCLRSDPLPRVVLLDLMMAGMNGQQFRDAQLQDPRIAQVPVVVMTGDAKAEDKAELLGVSRVLHKPVGIDDLLAAVREP